MRRGRTVLRDAVAVLLVATMVPAADAAAQGASTPQLFGFGQFWLTSPVGSPGAPQLSFNMARVRVGVRGQAAPRLSYFLLTEMGQLAPRAPESRAGFALVDALLTYEVHPLLRVSAGQDYFRLGLEGSWLLPQLPFVLRSEAVDVFYLTLGRSGAYAYDSGLKIWGERTVPDATSAGYSVFVHNGTGLNAADDNDRKDVLARGWVRPVITGSPVLSSIHLGASFFRGASEITQTDGGTAAAEDLDEWVLGVEALLPLRIGSVQARVFGEYLTGEYQPSERLPNPVPRVRPEGWYLAAGVMPHPRLELLIRETRLDGDREQPESGAATTTVGLQSTFAAGASLKLNYLWRRPERAFRPVGAGGADDLVVAQLQIVF